MITILSSPKAFTGLAATHQRNAILSWLALAPEVEVILYGKADGAESVAREVGVKWVPDIATNEFGTPIFNAIVGHAERVGRYDTQLYVNGDIILTSDLLDAARSIAFRRYLVIGQRIDLAEETSIDVIDPNWPQEFFRLVAEGSISLHSPAGSDYFLFPRGLWRDLSGDIAIGRGGYDNALLAHCLQSGVPILDASLAVPVFHQFHGYGHVKGGPDAVFRGSEAARNLAAVNPTRLVVLVDATWRLTGENRLVRAWSRGDWIRTIETEIRFRRNWTAVANACLKLRQLAQALGISRPSDLTLADIVSNVRARQSPSVCADPSAART